MDFHEAANIFPLDEDNVGELAKDIRANGQQCAVELLDGKIIDGRRRYLACRKLGRDPETRNVKPADPVAYVLSLNLHRRHLTPAQRAMVGARARDWYDKQAKARMMSGKKNPVEKLPQGAETGKARDAVGKSVGVSGKYIDYATKVIGTGTPELIAAVDEGKVAMDTAAILASESPSKQREEVAKPKRNRTYGSISKPITNGQMEDEPEHDASGKRRGVGVLLANEAINCLIRIPKNDALRKRGFQIVTDWIKANK